jgi:hypothetical protein
MLSIALSMAMHASSAVALDEPKVTIAYSLETKDGGTYFQNISGTLLGIGDADFIFDVDVDIIPGESNVDVLVASPLLVTLEFTADAPGGNIVDGPVELVYTEFEREFVIDSGATVVHTVLSTVLSRKGTGTLSGSTITWENVVAPYQEDVIGESTCTGSFCGFAGPWPRIQTGTFDVPLPTFTVLEDTIFGDSFVSNNGTPPDGTRGEPSDASDDIDRPDPNEDPENPDSEVRDTWDGVEVPEPSGEILLLAGVLGLVGLGRLRERGDRRRALREPSPIGPELGGRAGSHRR